MKKLLEYAEARDTVVVRRVDRLRRSLIDVQNTVNLLRERGVNAGSISDGIDPATTTGRMMLNMLASLAEYERKLIVERASAGIAAAWQSGTRFGRPLSDPVVIADKLSIAKGPEPRAAPSKTLHAWSSGVARRCTNGPQRRCCQRTRDNQLTLPPSAFTVAYRVIPFHYYQDPTQAGVDVKDAFKK